MCEEARPAVDRDRLGFAAAAKTAFAFLFSHGFRVVDEQVTIVRFEGDVAYANVYHGRSSYEVGLEIGSLQAVQSESGYSMSALLRLHNPEEAARYRNPIATTADDLQASLNALAEKLKAVGFPERARNEAFFESLAQQRRQWAVEYALDILTEQTRPDAEEAFRRKDYALAVELYEKIRDRLSPSEQRKVEYAKKSIGR